MKTTVAPYQTSTWCIRIECVGGLIIRLTTYPKDLKMSNLNIYQTDSGYDQTAFNTDTSFSPSSIDLTGFIGVAGITAEQIMSGVFDNARVYIFKCNYLIPVENYEPVMAGILGKTTLEDDKYTIQGMSLLDALNQNVGKTYTASCSRTFGDTGCTKNLASLTVTGTLTSVTNSNVFIDSSRAESSDYFSTGLIKFISGANAGLKALEIKSYSAGQIEVFESFFYTPAIGDTYTMTPGCRKRIEDCRDKWSNIVNFFGFTWMPTQSIYSQIAGR